MSIGDSSPYSIDTDYSAISNDFAPTSGRVGTAPATTQAGRAQLFRNPAGVFSLANVDGSGNQYVLPLNPSGGSLQVGTGQASGATTTQFGTLVMGRMDSPSPASYQAMTMDAVGAIQMHAKSKATFNCIQTAVACAANKSLFSIVNGGSQIIRVQRAFIYSPPQNTSGALLGQGGTIYLPLIVEMRRITGHTRGTSTATPTWSACDTADVPDSNLTMYSNATLIGASTAPFHRQDVLITTSTGEPYYARAEQNSKTMVLRPGEGVSFTCISNGQIASGGGTVTASVDVFVQITQAAG